MRRLLPFLAIAALAACGGGGGGGGIDFTGRWNVVAPVTSNTCPTNSNGVRDEFLVGRNGDAVVVNDTSGATYGGSVTGDRSFRVSGLIAEDCAGSDLRGITTIEYTNITTTSADLGIVFDFTRCSGAHICAINFRGTAARLSTGGGNTPPPSSCIPPGNCCKVCSGGQACGDTCIQASDTCHVGAGCACDNEEVC